MRQAGHPLARKQVDLCVGAGRGERYRSGGDSRRDEIFTCGVMLCTPDNRPACAFPFRAVACGLLGQIEGAVRREDRNRSKGGPAVVRHREGKVKQQGQWDIYVCKGEWGVTAIC